MKRYATASTSIDITVERGFFRLLRDRLSAMRHVSSTFRYRIRSGALTLGERSQCLLAIIILLIPPLSLRCHVDFGPLDVTPVFSSIWS
jgi:hypothetical protein